MKKRVCAFFLVLFALSLLTGCGSDNTGSNHEDDAAEGYGSLGGAWTVSGICLGNGDDKLIDVHDNEALEDLYDSVILSFNRDGSFMYVNGLIYSGDYVKSADGNRTYILTTTSNLIFENGELVEKEYSGAAKHLITFINESTFEFAEYDPITGKAKANEYTLVFIRDDTSSSYMDTNKNMT